MSDDPYDLADIARRVMHREAESALHWAGGEIGRLRAKVEECAQLFAGQMRRAEEAERQCLELHTQLTQAMQQVERWYGRATEAESEAARLRGQVAGAIRERDRWQQEAAGPVAVVAAARRYRDAVRAVDGIADAEQALLAAVEQVEKGQRDG